MAVTTLVNGVKLGSAVCALADNSIVVSSIGGKLTRYDATGVVLEMGAVGSAVRSLAAHPAGDRVLATVKNGLLSIEFGPTPSITKLASISGAWGLAVDAATGTALVTSSTSGRLLRVSLASPTNPLIVATGLATPGAITVRAGASLANLLSRAGTTSLLPVDLTSGEAGLPVTVLGAARDLSWTDIAGTQIAVGETDRIVLVDPADSAQPPFVLATGLKRVWSVDFLPSYGALVVGSGQSLLLIDLPVAPPVSLEMPPKAMYLSSWARIGVATNGVAFDDVIFHVEPAEGGIISHSKDATFAKRPSVVLAASAVAGSYKVIAHDRNTGDELASGTFEITNVWTGKDGPPASYIGVVGAEVPDPAWGGGDPYVPQNLAVTPVIGDRRVAIVILETTDITALSIADQTVLRTTWQNEVFDGVSRGGVLESARRYWRDVSDNQMDLVNAGVIGPIRLTNNWDSYGTAINTTTGRTDGWEGFARAAIANIRSMNNTAVSAGQAPVLDLMTVDSIVLVMRSLPASGANPGRFTWPSATRPGSYQLTFEVDRKTIQVPVLWGSINITIPINRTIQMFSMPDDWETRDISGRVRAETVAHELGHNFGLPDEYARSGHPQWAKDRDLAATTTRGASWSVMSWEEEFSQPTVVEKMMLGWVLAAHVRNLSFATLGPVDEEIVLHASDLGSPPAGRYSVVEVRIADGRNYYFEYRRERPGTLKDQDVPADQTVVGVDCMSGLEPTDRRNILRIRDDGDLDRGEFQQGDNYEEKDTSSAAYPNDFKMDVVETGTDFARIHITYGDAKPDPQIRPWAPSTNWKSPDLRVTNARNLADTRFRDIPWEGHDNRIVATVRNPGQIDALGVRVNFFVKDFTLGGGAVTALGSDVHDVMSGAEVEFTSSVPWVPPPLSAIPFLNNVASHYCVVAQIEEYRDPNNAAIREITLDNNEAQSNHTQMISVSASPSTREIGVVKVTNPLPSASTCQVVVRQSSPWFRTYVEKSWVHLQPGEERNVMFMSESPIGDPLLDVWMREFREHIYREPNSLRLTGIADDHETCHGLVTGGAHVLVRAARATCFDRFAVSRNGVSGRIKIIDNEQGANGKVIITLLSPGELDKEIVQEGNVQEGTFQIELGNVRSDCLVQGYYLGGFDLAPCQSEQLKIH
ncbi:hypothetical protein [Pseudomonas sp. GM17]|uniref:hypothetical protein n=1 Tax=Pseudomonas sp. GM17 TaxID=1144323 RepID=UPI00027243F3|nr:hypothetical protein [Pseudomonas sp. GM17]WIE50666.1 hypothetical protein PMI20_003340 [Pseudomonas sp. GM17]